MVMTTNWIDDKEDVLTLEKECFCTHHNGAMHDFMTELDDTHALTNSNG